MFTSALLALAALAAFVKADPVPLEPDSTSVFTEGGPCTIDWTPDSTGKWTTMYIELMTGDNFNQVHLKTVATVDGTNNSNHTFSYTCPGVTPHAAIYFYKFTSPGAPDDALFTTRFTITDSTGATTVPTGTETGSGGTIVAWGTGALTDPTQGDQPPDLGNSTDTSGATSMPSSAIATDVGSGSVANPTGASHPTGTLTGASTTMISSTSTTNAAGHALPSLALGIAGAFAAMLFL